MDDPADRLEKLGVPVKRHPPQALIDQTIKRFLAEHSAAFETLKSLIATKQEVTPVMRIFFEFIDSSEFDKKYSEGEVFSALCFLAEGSNAGSKH